MVGASYAFMVSNISIIHILLDVNLLSSFLVEVAYLCNLSCLRVEHNEFTPMTHYMLACLICVSSMHECITLYYNEECNNMKNLKLH